VKGGSDRQQLGDNWRPQQFGYWRARGIDCLGPSASEILLLIMDGVDNIMTLADKMSLSASVTTGHVRRLCGLQLVSWTFKRGAKITPLVRIVDRSDYEPITLGY
jgi:hypothetical protein